VDSTVSDYKSKTFNSLIEEFTFMVDRDFGTPTKFEMGQVRRVVVMGVCDTLVLLLGKAEDRTWECEDIRTGRGRLVDERYMGNETFNAMEVIAWASR
jgi:hypothetical protein